MEAFFVVVLAGIMLGVGVAALLAVRRLGVLRPQTPTSAPEPTTEDRVR